VCAWVLSKVAGGVASRLPGSTSWGRSTRWKPLRSLSRRSKEVPELFPDGVSQDVYQTKEKLDEAEHHTRSAEIQDPRAVFQEVTERTQRRSPIGDIG
jgi:hypothetical protein